jgi:hypothetical protein
MPSLVAIREMVDDNRLRLRELAKFALDEIAYPENLDEETCQ